jgi:hypothetical protein
LTAQGNPRTIFRRAIERGSLGVAEMTADEVGRLTLGEALALTALVASDGFFMVMRMYQPEDQMYRGEYIVPPVMRI